MELSTVGITTSAHFAIDVVFEESTLRTMEQLLPAGTVLEDVRRINGTVYGIMHRPGRTPHSFCMKEAEFKELPLLLSL